MNQILQYNFSSIVSQSSCGKSTAAIVCAIDFARQGKQVLFTNPLQDTSGLYKIMKNSNHSIDVLQLNFRKMLDHIPNYDLVIIDDLNHHLHNVQKYHNELFYNLVANLNAEASKFNTKIIVTINIGRLMNESLQDAIHSGTYKNVDYLKEFDSIWLSTKVYKENVAKISLTNILKPTEVQLFNNFNQTEVNQNFFLE